jgi:peptidoglycan hydrolase-like protein with peptidoglycan-binding domain
MRKIRVRSEQVRAKLRLTRSGSLFVAALLAGGVLGPLAGIAVGAGTTTTETVTLPAGCTTASKTTTTTGGTGGVGLGGTTVTYNTTTTVVATPPTTTTGTDTTGSTTTATTLGTTSTETVIYPVTLTSTTPTTTSTSTSPTCTSTTTTKIVVPPYVPPTNTSAAPAVIKAPVHNPLADHAMWIWLMSATDGGNISKIIAQAKLDGIQTLIIKNGDGRTPWSQFNPTLVKEIHAAGLKVCAWQYVYGNYPLQEAEVGADAKSDGADCLIIDAEVQYQGRYVAAQTYIKDLRARVGAKFSVGLAGLPYVEYHESFPYSVFLGPNGAQFNMPQMYWIDIGTTVPYIYQTTYTENSIYQRPIYPLGQLYGDSYGSPNALSVGQFNTLAKDYKAGGVSWWDFQSATPSWLVDTNHVAAAPANFVAYTNAVTLVKGNIGDQVIWAQQHLDGAGAKIAIDGDYGASTVTAVKDFQAAHGIPVSGQINGRTWDVLLRYKATPVTWKNKGKVLYATVASAGRKIRAAVSLRHR